MVEKAPQQDYFDSDEEDEIPEEPDEVKNEKLFQAAKTGDHATAYEYLNMAKPASYAYVKDGWNALLWAACNGDEEMVRMLVKAGAAGMYTNNEQEQAEDPDKTGDEHDPFQKPQDASKTGQYTPLHWAAYKGHYRVVWILLKNNMSASKEDMYGNNAVHQAAASGSVKVFKLSLIHI